MAYDLATELDTLLDGITTITAAERFEFSKAFFLDSFTEKNIKETHLTFGGVRKGNKIPIVGTEGGYDAFPYFDGCQLPSCDIGNAWSDYTWCLGEIGCELTICMKDLQSKFLSFFNIYRKMNEGDMRTAFVQFIGKIFQDAHLKAEQRVLYLGDTSAQKDVGDEEVELVDEPLFNGCDGFITQMAAYATTNPSHKVTITENSKGTYAAQTITDGEDIYDYVKDMYTKAAAMPWFTSESGQMTIKMNRTLANALVGWLNTLDDMRGINCSCIDPSKVTGPRGFSIDNLQMFGINVEVFDFEAMMKTSNYYDDGTKFTKGKNFIILARKDVMQIGYEDAESLSSFDMGYDKRKREVYIQGASLLGAGVPVPYFIIAH